MYIFFLFPSIRNTKSINHGVASLCGLIQQKGHHVDLYQPDSLNTDELHKKFKEKPYALCLVSAVTNQWPYAIKLVKELKKISGIMVIAGGHHVTSCPEVLRDTEELDGICLGEGERAVGELLDRLAAGEDYHRISNMWFKQRDTGEIFKNEIGNLIEPLDSLPFPDYSVFTAETVLNYPALMLSRGCPYSCTYCCNGRLRSMYAGKGKYVRQKSVERAIEEVRRFIEAFHPPVIFFDDDTFFKGQKWFFEFLEQYTALTATPFNCNTRAETVTDEICTRLKEANCSFLAIGVESGSEQLRKTILKRNMTNESIRKAFSLAKKHGLKVFAFNMVGVPGETYKDYMETVKLNRELQPDLSQITIFYPYPGTELYQVSREKGYLNAEGFSSDYFSKSILTMKQFPQWQIKLAHRLFHFNVLREKSLLRAIYYLLRYNTIRSYSIKLFFRKLFRSRKQPA